MTFLLGIFLPASVQGSLVTSENAMLVRLSESTGNERGAGEHRFGLAPRADPVLHPSDLSEETTRRDVHSRSELSLQPNVTPLKDFAKLTWMLNPALRTTLSNALSRRQGSAKYANVEAFTSEKISQFHAWFGGHLVKAGDRVLSSEDENEAFLIWTAMVQKESVKMSLTGSVGWGCAIHYHSANVIYDGKDMVTWETK